MLTHRSYTLILFAALMVTACQVEVQGGDETLTPLEPEEPKQVTSNSSSYGVLFISTKVTTNSLDVSFTGVPADARLECHINQHPLQPCHDGAVYRLPTAGTHKISAVAIKNETIVAIGESKTFEITAHDDTGTSSDADRLLLASKLPNFELHATHLADQPFVARFDFAAVPACDATLRCAFGQSSSVFWGRCDTDGKSFTVTPEMLAMGPQTVKVRGQCGDTIGPELHFPFIAVPADYEPLMLIHRKDNTGRHTFDLLVSTDCIGEDAKFECSEPNSEFAGCQNALKDPTPGTQIRLVCGATVGPALTID